MTVVSIHPEELLDKLSQGELSSAERELLEQHVAQCGVCRFELQVGQDLEREAEALVLHSPPAQLLVGGGVAAAAARPLPLKGRRPRGRTLALAVATLVTATGAVASVAGARDVFFALLEVGKPDAAPVAAASASAAPRKRAPVRGPFDRPLSRSAAEIASAAARPSAELVVPASPPAAHAQKPPASAPAPAEASSTESAPALFSAANQARRRGDLAQSAGLYRKLQGLFPRSQEAELSQVTLSLLLLDSGDAAGALAGFESYLGRGRRPLDAEARVGRARALRALGSREAEVEAWRDVKRRYPSSVYGRQATERLEALGQP